eukprot:gene2558-3168_t
MTSQKKFLFSSILLLVLFQFCQSVSFNSQKISNGVNEKIINLQSSGASTENQHKLWVYFTTKDYNSDGHVSKLNKMSSSLKNADESEIILALSGIDDSAVRRRMMRSESEKLVDESDLPVQQSLIDSVVKCGVMAPSRFNIKLGQQSKWLNAISITISSNSQKVLRSTIQCVANLPFVSKIDLVNKYYNKNKLSVKENEMVQVSREELPVVERISQNTNYRDSPEAFYGFTYDGLNQANIPNIQMTEGYDGSGLTILMMDSGYLKTHEAFQHMKIKDEYDFINNQVDTQGPLGDPQNKHGTATLSTIGGYVPGRLIGPAYNATFLLAKTEDTSIEDVIEEDYWISALEWGEARGAELISSSLGYSDWYTYADMDSTVAPITKAADKAVEKGMVVVISAGNSDNKGISAPADGHNVFAVGAVTPQGINTYFSSLGPSSDGRVKPDISALGLNNYVANHIGDYNYTTMSGTSFACPLAAGGIALLMQAHPDWTPRQVYEAMTSTAHDADHPNIKTGYGIVNIEAAINYTPMDANVNCLTKQCSNHGECCPDVTNNRQPTCFCNNDNYGPFCEYSKIPCTNTECGARGGKCVDTYVCVNNNATTIHHSKNNSQLHRKLSCGSTGIHRF